MRRLRSLPLGETRDVTRFSSAYAVASLRGFDATLAVPNGENAMQIALVQFDQWTVTRRDECQHVRSSAYGGALA